MYTHVYVQTLIYGRICGTWLVSIHTCHDGMHPGWAGRTRTTATWEWPAKRLDFAIDAGPGYMAQRVLVPNIDKLWFQKSYP